MIDKKYMMALAQKYGIMLDGTALDKFDRYASLLVEWNQKFNLTAITDPKEIVIKHFVDSLLLMRYCDISQEAKVADIGAGAGFPSVPLAIVRPDLMITQVDSMNKRVGFLNMLKDELEINTHAVHLRAEDGGQSPEYREQFDFVTARAVASLGDLCEYCLPYVKPGGYFAAMKGPDGTKEAKNAKKAAVVLGGDIYVVRVYSLEDSERTAVIVKKISQTPTKYPRIRAKMKKNPL